MSYSSRVIALLSSMAFSTTAWRASAFCGASGRVVVRRRFQQAREQRRFAERQLRRLLAEVSARRGFGAVEAVAEIHLVQIELEDLVLREVVFELRGEQQFAQLAAQRFFAADALPRQLLRDGAAALDRFAGARDRDRRADDANRVEAVVIEEAAIFDGDDRLDQVRRNLGKRHLNPVLFGDGKNFPIGRVKKDVGAGHVGKRAQLLLARDAAHQIDDKPAKSGQKHQPGHSGRPASATVELAEEVKAIEGTAATAVPAKIAHYSRGRPVPACIPTVRSGVRHRLRHVDLGTVVRRVSKERETCVS